MSEIQYIQGLSYKTYLISTNEQTERQAKTMRMLTQIPAFRHVCLLSSERDMEDTRRGCFKAHQRWAADTFNNSLDFAVVFEDDIEIPDIDSFQDRFEECVTFFKSQNVPPDVLFLGHLPYGKMRSVTPHGGFASVKKTSLTHAMMVSKLFAHTIAGWTYTPGTHVDQKITKWSFNMYAKYPMIVFQNDTPTTHSRMLDVAMFQIRSVIGAPSLCRWAEWFFLRK